MIRRKARNYFQLSTKTVINRKRRQQHLQQTNNDNTLDAIERCRSKLQIQKLMV